MSIKTKDEQGNEIETFTQAELEEQATKRAEEAAAKAREEAEAEKQAEIDRLQQEKEELQKKADDKDRNWKNLRDKAENKSGDSEELKKQVEEITKRLNDLGQQPVKSAYESFIAKNVPEDKDKREKFDYYYKKLSQGATSPEDHTKAMQEALALAAPGVKVSDSQYFSTRVDQNYRQSQSTERSDEHRAFASGLGLSDEDFKKYGKKNK